MYHDVDGWWWLWGVLMMLLFWGGIAFLVAWAVRSLAGRDESSDHEALQIAERRYASGEISREEFERIRDDLAAGRATRPRPRG